MRQYRFPTRPSTSYIELRPTGSLSEKFIVDMKLAAGPSARRGHGSDCLGRAALLGLSEGAKRPRFGSPELRSSPRLEMSASLPSLPSLPPPLPPPPPLLPPPQRWDTQQPLKERARAELSLEAFGQLELACETALERHREGVVPERATRAAEAGEESDEAGEGGDDWAAETGRPAAAEDVLSGSVGGGGVCGGGGVGGGGDGDVGDAARRAGRRAAAGSRTPATAEGGRRDAPRRPLSLTSLWSARRTSLLQQARTSTPAARPMRGLAEVSPRAL